MKHTLINCTCKNRLGFSLLSFTLIPQYFKRFNWSKIRSRKWNLKTKQWNPLSLRLFSVASMTSWSFQTVRRMREAWQRETGARYQSFSPKSAVKYIHVGGRKIQISPPGRTRSVKCPTPGPTKTIKSPPCFKRFLKSFVFSYSSKSKYRSFFILTSDVDWKFD